jgi:PAS domain S-box-containing protein
VRYIVVPIVALAGQGGAAASAAAPAEPGGDALAHWVKAACRSLDACLVVDVAGTVSALSPTAADLLGTDAATVLGRSLDEVLHLVGYTESAGEARGAERRIPPLIAVRENSLSRGMMRVRRPDGARLMLDAVAAPIHDSDSNPIGAVSFLASV